MKKAVILFFLILSSSLITAQQLVKGTLSDQFAGLPLGTVENLTQKTSTTTDNSGEYEIMANIGDRLQFSFPGKRSLVFIVEDITRTLNVRLEDEITELDNVVVTRKGQKTLKELYKEYNANPAIVKTVFGYLDTEAASYQIRTMNEKNMVQAGGDLATMIRGRFPGVKIANDGLGMPQIFLRETASFNAVPAGYDIDNVLYDTYPNWLDANSIFRLAIIPSRSANTRYGSFGAGGMIIINTHNSNIHPVGEDGKPIDLVRLDDNLFKYEVLEDEDLYDSKHSKLIQSFDDGEDLTDYLSRAGSSFSNYDWISVAQKMNDLNLEKELAALHQAYLEKFAEHAPSLKAYGYWLHSIRDFKISLTFFQTVFKLRPNYLQSYIDLADSYESLGQVQKALSLYVRATNLVNSGYIVSPSDEGLLYNFDRSYDSFLKRNKETFAKLDFEWDSEDAGTEVTLYFDETEAEFELFFVNPENQYFTENYSTWANLDLINNNKSLGLSSLEFFIDQNLRGEWKVYLKYLGNKKQTPSSIKLIARSKYPNSNKTPLVLFKKLTAEDELVLLGTLTN